MLLMIISDQVIEDIEWSPDDSLIIVGVSEGTLYVVDDNFKQVIEETEWSPDDSLIIVCVSEGILYVGDDNFRSSYRGNRMEPR